jgi:hypothetical protein
MADRPTIREAAREYLRLLDRVGVDVRDAPEVIAGLIRQVEAFVPGDAAVAAVLVDDTPYLAGAVSTSPSLYLIQPTSFERMADPHHRSYSCRAYPLADRLCQREVTTRWLNGFGEDYRVSQWTFDAGGIVLVFETAGGADNEGPATFARVLSDAMGFPATGGESAG